MSVPGECFAMKDERFKASCLFFSVTEIGERRWGVFCSET